MHTRRLVFRRLPVVGGNFSPGLLLRSLGRSLLVLGLLTLATASPAAGPVTPTPARAERIPWLDPAPGPRLAAPLRERPVRLKSGAFAGAGELAANLAAVWAGRPDAPAARVLVQLDRPPEAAARARLEQAGVKLLGYVPEGAYFAHVRRGADLAQAAQTGVRWLGAVYPEDKLSETLRAGAPGRWALEPDGRVNLRVWPFEDASLADLREALAGLGIEVTRESPDTHEVQVRAAPGAVLALAGLDAVRWVEEVPPPIALYNDGLRTNLQVTALEDPPYNLTGAGVVAGIWDGGWVDIDHPDLAGRVYRGEASVPQTRNRHATHVAGTLAGSGAASESAGGGPRQWRGVAPGLTLVTYDVNTGPLIEEHRLAREQYNAVISQNSWGVTVSEFFGNCHLLGDYAADAPNYDRLVTGLYGAPYHVIFAVGNARTRNTSNDCPAPEGYRTVGVPATAKNVIAVGAIHSDDNSMTAFSGWGPTDDGRLKPEIVAPGDEVGGDGGITSTVPDGPYGVLVGTSMAAPAVSGATALLIEDYRRQYGGQTPLPALVKGLLVHTAEDLNDATDWFQPGPDYASGYGRVQVRAAVDQLRSGGWLLGRVTPDQSAVYTLTVPPGAPVVKLTLVWDDVPALQNAARTLVNDLDLVVLDPAGTRHYPWTLDPDNPAAPATRNRPDHVNNLEQVFVDRDIVPGAWQVLVVGNNLPLGAEQKFALVFSPVGMPSAPVLTLAAGLPDDSAGGNANGVLDPGEEIEEWPVLQNVVGPGASNLIARLTTDSPWVQLLQTEAAYPDLPPGGSGTNLTRLAYRVSKHAPCGEVLRFEHVTALDGVRITNRFQRVVGRLEVTNIATAVFAAADTPVPLPDLATAVSTLPVAITGTVLEVKAAVRLDHTWLDDLDLKLRAPDGAATVLMPPLLVFGQNLGRGDCGAAVEWTRFDDAAGAALTAGAAPFVGTFRPHEPLAGLTNRPLAGPWQLVITDTSAEDTGTLLCWELEVRYAQAGYVCEFFNRPPQVTDLSRSVWYERPLELQLAAADPDEDPLTYQLLDPPQHGTLSEFDPATGRVRYTPAPGYSGPDAFTFHVTDGYADSPVGTVSLEVQTPAVDLRLEAALDPPAPRHDQPFALVLTVTNPGPNDAPAVMLTATLPDGLNVVRAAASQGSVSQQRQTLIAVLGTLPEGAQATLTLTLEAAAPGEFLVNASASTGTRELNIADNLIHPAVPVQPTADLALTGQTLPGPVPTGQPLDVLLRVTNRGPFAAGAVAVTADLPPATTLVTAALSQGEWTTEPGRFRAALGALGVDETATLALTLLPEQPGPWQLTALASAAEPDPDPANNQTTAGVEVRPVTDLQLTWLPAPGPVGLGGAFTNVLRLVNRGAVPATAVAARIESGPGQTLLAAVPSAGEAAPEAGGVNWTLAELAPGAEATLELAWQAEAIGSLTHTATVTAFEFDAHPEDNTAAVVVEARAVADLALSFTPPAGRIVPGVPAQYAFMVTNRGPVEATQVVLTHAVPAGLSVRTLAATQGTVELAENQVVATLGTLAAEATATVTLEFEAAAPGVVSGQATVTAFEVDPAPGDNTQDFAFAVEPPADLAVALALEPATVLLTREALLTVLATNAGPHDATGVRLTLARPEGLAFGAAEVSQGTVETAPDVLHFVLGDLPAGAVATGRVHLAATLPGVWTNRVTVLADQPDLDPANNESLAPLEVVPAVDLAAFQTLPDPPLVAGREFPLVLTLTNRGPLAATGVRLTSLLPAGLEVLNVEGPDEACAVQDGALTCDLGELAAGAATTVTLTLRAPQPGPFTNLVSLAADQADLEPADNTSELVGQIEPDADLALACSSAPDAPAVGQPFRVLATVHNRGPYPASAVVLRAWLPPAVTLLTVRPAQGTWELQGAEVLVTLGELPVEGLAPVEFELLPAASGAHAVRLEVAGAEPDLEPGNNLCETGVTVSPTANLALTLGAMPALASPGQPFHLLVSVTNRGPETARQLVVNGETPAGLELLSATFDFGDWEAQPGGWVWRLEELPPGTAESLTLTWQAASLGDFTHRASVTAPEADPDLADNQAETTVAVRPSANLTLRLEGPTSPVRRDRPTTYLWRLENQGPEPATAVVLAHPLPAAFTLEALHADAGAAEVAEGRVTWRVPELAPDAAASLQVTVTPQSAGAVQLTATAASDENDPDPQDNHVDATVEVFDLADLAVSLAASPDSPLWRQDAQLEVTVTNRGPHAATGVVLTLSPPPGLEALAWEMEPPANLNTNDGAWVLNWDALEAGASAVARLRGRFTEVGARPLRAHAAARSLDEAPDDNTAELTLEVRPAADLRLTKTVLDQPALRDLPLHYRLVVSNAGLIPATAVRLTDPLPETTELLELRADLGTAALVERDVIFEPGDLDPGAQATLELALRPLATGSLTNLATVVMAEPDPRPEDNSAAAVCEVVRAADLAVALAVPPSPVALGAPFTCQVTLTNRGPHAATAVVLTGNLPAGARLVEIAAEPGEVVTNDTTWTLSLDELAAGAAATVTLTWVPDAEGDLALQAAAQAAELDPDPANNTAGATLAARPVADLQLVLLSDADARVVGRELGLLLAVTNHGPHAATGVRITYQLPPHAELTRLEGSEGTWTPTATGFTAEFESLPPGAIVWAEFAVRATEPGPSPHAAEVTAGTFDPTPDNNRASLEVGVYVEADLQVWQAPLPPALLLSNQYVVTVVVTNRGLISAQRVQMLVAFSLNADLLEAEFVGGDAVLAPPGVVCNMGTMPPGSSAVLTVLVRPNRVGTLVSQAALRSPAADPDNPALLSRLEVPVFDRPLLLGRREGNRLTLSWPALAADYDLEFTDDLGSGLWQPVLNPKLILGDEVQVNLKLSAPQRYYRLRKPGP
jgi:uncharacterized repeat protein (TIGR01451 family)